MDMHHRRQLFSSLIGTFGKAIDGGHASRLSLERSDAKSHMPKDATVFFELANDLSLERVLLRIKVRSQVRHCHGNLSRTRSREVQEQEADEQNSYKRHGGVITFDSLCRLVS
jgi:hypothetical protein